jgi:hypothetical protein
MKGIIKKSFFDFGSLLTEISQKSFLGTCHVPGLSFLAHMVQIYWEQAQNDRNEFNYKLIESFFLFKALKKFFFENKRIFRFWQIWFLTNFKVQ